jgi:hypothetical protein
VVELVGTRDFAPLVGCEDYMIRRKLSFEERQLLRKLVSEKKKAIYRKDVKYKLV